jgi:hypothetical protein
VPRERCQAIFGNSRFQAPIFRGFEVVGGAVTSGRFGVDMVVSGGRGTWLGSFESRSFRLRLGRLGDFVDDDAAPFFSWAGLSWSRMRQGWRRCRHLSKTTLRRRFRPPLRYETRLAYKMTEFASPGGRGRRFYRETNYYKKRSERDQDALTFGVRLPWLWIHLEDEGAAADFVGDDKKSLAVGAVGWIDEDQAFGAEVVRDAAVVLIVRTEAGIEIGFKDGI